ncbi:MAG: helix-turn-helix domain-containing protein [Candidatus Andersenbacteria bacterium]
MVSGFFTRKITQVAPVGELLEQRRLALGIAIERIARETQVQDKYLRALELGDATVLPADIYVRGFLRTYARYLRLDDAALVEQWNKERGISKHIVQHAEQQAAQAAQAQTFAERKPLLPRLRITPTLVRFGLIGLGVLTVALYLILSVANLTRAPQLSLEEPTSDRVVTDSSLVVVGQTTSGATLSINDQPVHVSEDGHFRETLNLQQGLNEVVLAARNKLGRETRIVRRIQANLTPIATSKPGLALADAATGATNGVNLTVRVHKEATAIVVEADGKIIFDGTLLPNVSKQFTAGSQILLTSNKAEYTEVQWGDGETVPNLGKGLVRRVAFTPGMTADDLTLTAVRN